MIVCHLCSGYHLMPLANLHFAQDICQGICQEPYVLSNTKIEQDLRNQMNSIGTTQRVPSESRATGQLFRNNEFRCMLFLLCTSSLSTNRSMVTQL